MSEEMYAALNRCATIAKCNRAEVFGRMIALYERAQDCQLRGGKVLLRDGVGTTTELTGL